MLYNIMKKINIYILVYSSDIYQLLLYYLIFIKDYVVYNLDGVFFYILDNLVTLFESRHTVTTDLKINNNYEAAFCA